MDLIYKLPLEIADKIFCFLDDCDLWRCLFVSKYWRMVGNQNRLWEEHCRNITIDIDELEPSNNGFDLCTAAREWMVAKKRASSWKTNNTKNFLLKSSPIAFYKDKLLFVNNILQVDLYSVTSDGPTYLNKIKIPESSAVTISVLISGEMNSTFIAVNTLEIIIIHHGYVNSTFQMALGIKDGKVIDVSDDISGYLLFKENKSKDHFFEQTCLCGNTLLILLQNVFLQMGPVFMVDLMKKEIIQIYIPFLYTCAVPSKNHVYFGTAKQVVIFDTSGKVSFESDNFNLIDNNDNFVAELCKNELNIYSLSLKQCIKKVKEMGEISHVLAPTYCDYVFLLEKTTPKIIAYSLKSGKKIWERGLDHLPTRDVFLRFISGLVMAYRITPDNSINKRILGVFDGKSGIEHDVDDIERYNYFKLKKIEGRLFIQYPCQ